MRGISVDTPLELSQIGIIPADAGHFQPSIRNDECRPDHPRRCGAFFISAHLFFLASGSSPQMRGISVIRGEKASAYRIIPADAGHLGAKKKTRSCTRDHPRRCGAFPFS